MNSHVLGHDVYLLHVFCDHGHQTMLAGRCSTASLELPRRCVECSRELRLVGTGEPLFECSKRITRLWDEAREPPKQVSIPWDLQK